MSEINFTPTNGPHAASMRDEEFYRSPLTLGAEAVMIKGKTGTFTGGGIKGKLLFQNCTNQRFNIEGDAKFFEKGGYKFGASAGPDFLVHDKVAIGAQIGVDVTALDKLKKTIVDEKEVIVQKYGQEETSIYGGAYVKYRPASNIHLQAGVKGGLINDGTNHQVIKRSGRVGFEGRAEIYMGSGLKAGARVDSFKKEAAVGITYTF